uniref:Uncharacterized protein n=1 Tax=Dunaliella tertiolecta TaxID=3047 RepID=A0A7S3QTT4_DUNTE
MAEASTGEGVDDGAEGGESPIASVGIMGVWQLLLDLGLRGLAEQAHELATTVFMRSSSMEPMALALAVARTHMLPPQPHFHHLGIRSSALQQQQQQDGSRVDLIAAGVDQGSLSGDRGGAAASERPAVQDKLGDDDFRSALRALCTASRMAEAQTSSSSAQQPIDGEAGLGAAEDEDESSTDRAGCLQVLPLVLIGDLMWMAAGRRAEEGSAQESEGSGNGKYEERRREARTAYQKVVELVAAAGTQGNKYSPEGRLPEAAPRSAILLGTGAATSTSSLGTGAALGEGDGAASSEHSGAPGMEPWLLLRAHLRLGQSFLEDEAKAQCAMDVCAAAVALWPTCVAAWKGAAQAAQSLGNTTAARAAWAEANVLNTEDGQTWAALATIDLREGRKQEAVQAIHKALALTAAVAAAPHTCTACPAEDEGGLLVEAAGAASKAGDLLEASNWLHQALDLGHHTFAVYEQLALVQAGRHDVLGSRTYAQKAGDLAQTETQRQAAAALQQSTSLESHMRQYALGMSS